jgi:hypothetical protein
VVGLKSDLDRFGRLANHLKSQHVSAKHSIPDSEVPTEGDVVTFEVDASSIRRLKLSLDQEISIVAVFVLSKAVSFLSKQDLEVFAARTRDRRRAGARTQSSGLWLDDLTAGRTSFRAQAWGPEPKSVYTSPLIESNPARATVPPL